MPELRLSLFHLLDKAAEPVHQDLPFRIRWNIKACYIVKQYTNNYQNGHVKAASSLERSTYKGYGICLKPERAGTAIEWGYYHRCQGVQERHEQFRCIQMKTGEGIMERSPMTVNMFWWKHAQC